MLNKIAIIGAASLFAVSVASAQTSAPSGTAGGAVGTSNQQERGTTGAAPKSMQGMTKGSTTPKRGHSSPDATAGGATGTSKTGSERNPTPR